MKSLTLAYTAPFAVFGALMVLGDALRLDPRLAYPLRSALGFAVWLMFSRRLLPLRPRSPLASSLVGLAVLLVWVGPDWLWPSYRRHWLFDNPVTNPAREMPDAELWRDSWFLLMRAAGSTLVVPLVEELFWRGWLLRWLAARDFLRLPLNHYSPWAFWISAVLFALEHGSRSDVGFAAGVAYNWWMVRTGNLGDCTLAHAVTNGCLALYVVLSGRWEFWR